jgi:hypothetical protein
MNKPAPGTESTPAGGVDDPAAGAGPDKELTPEELRAEADKWKAMSRKHEAEAKANAAKAKQLDAFEEAQKSEQEKLTARAEAAEKALADVTARALRSEIAIAKGLPTTALPLIVGATEEEITSSVDALLAFKGATPKPDMGAGDTRGGDINGKTDLDAQIADATAKGDFQTAIALKERKHAEANQKK